MGSLTKFRRSEGSSWLVWPQFSRTFSSANWRTYRGSSIASFLLPSTPTSPIPSWFIQSYHQTRTRELLWRQIAITIYASPEDPWFSSFSTSNSCVSFTQWKAQFQCRNRKNSLSFPPLSWRLLRSPLPQNHFFSSIRLRWSKNKKII